MSNPDRSCVIRLTKAKACIPGPAGEHAVVAFRRGPLDVATNAGVTVDGRILIVLRKVDGKWLMAAHETVVRDQPL